jgi:hypothetical protein
MGSSDHRDRPLDIEQALLRARPPFCVRLSWRLLIPGLPQITWNQRERGMVYLVSFLTSLGTSLFCWGSLLGWCFLIFCFLTHMAAALDVVRQRAFPVFPSKVATTAAILGIGLTVYLPIGALLRSCAFSTLSDGAEGAGYLVNLLAYQQREPALGHFIWLRPSPASSQRAGQVIAVAGQEVEWTGRRWRVDGKDLQSTCPGSLPYFPNAWRFLVPPNHVLIGPETSSVKAESSSSLMIVSKEKIVGRAWVRYYPFWERSLL